MPARRGRVGRDEYISRPRFLAISEFGPRALVYHEGARYRVDKVNLDFGSGRIDDTRQLATETMKRCSRCGYAHVEAGGVNLAEACARCDTALDAASRIDSLVELQNVSLRLAQRITCDEEERQRFGYHLVTAYRFPEVNGRLDRKDAEVFCDGRHVLTLSYADATGLYRVNLGWAHQDKGAPRGFNLDVERGYWSRNQADVADRDDAASEARVVRVVPFVRDTKNALVMRFAPARSGPETASLQAAFKQAIQRQFQLEPRELACEPMPSRDERLEIFFHEVSEGGAGVLRRLVEDPTVLPALARRALAICHYDPTRSRTGPPTDAAGRATSACSTTGTSRTTGTWTASRSGTSSPSSRGPSAIPPEGRARVPSASPRCAGAATAGSRSAGSTRSTPWGCASRAMRSTGSPATRPSPTSSTAMRAPRSTSTGRHTTRRTRSAKTRPPPGR